METRVFVTEGPRKWQKSRLPTRHGGSICFRTVSGSSNSVMDFYTIPLYFANNGVGGPVYLKPFYRSSIPLSSTFVAVGSSYLFCLGGTEQIQHTLKPIQRIYRFDTSDPNRGWDVHNFHMLSGRDCHATIAMDGKVFVLGGLECSDDSRAEFFDPIWDSSLPLPQQLPSPLPSNSDKFATAALTDSKRILVASCISDEAYVYHVMTEEWEEWDQKANFFTKNPGRGEAAVLWNTTLCWFQEHDHVLHAYDLDLKMWLECPIRGLDEVGKQVPGHFLWCSLLSVDCDCLCLLWMDNSYYSNTKLRTIHCTKISASIKADAWGTYLFDASVISSRSYVVEEDTSLLDAVVVCAPVQGLTKGLRWGSSGFNSRRGRGRWVGHGCGGITSVGASSGNACFKCGETGHMARGCYQGGRGNSCFKCGETGHRARGCYQGGRGNSCFKCGETGHMARGCYQGGGRGNSCFKCGETGHRARGAIKAAEEILASSVGKQDTWLGVAINAAEEILASSVGKQGTWLGVAIKAAAEILASTVGKQGTWLGVAIKAAEEILASTVGKQGTWLGTALKAAGEILPLSMMKTASKVEAV